MSPSPWKLLGFALAPLGLAAGALAVASGPLAGQDEPPQAQAAPKAEGKPVDRRLDELEAKIDRIVTALAKPEASPAPTARAEITAPLPTLDFGPAPSPFENRGLREIEARLINAYQDYRRHQELVARNAAPRGQEEALIQPVRVLLAQLREMEDERNAMDVVTEIDISRISEDNRMIEELNTNLAALTLESEEARRSGADVDRNEEEFRRKVSEKQRSIEHARRSTEAAKNDLVKMDRSRQTIRARAEAARHLIDWTRKHFKDVMLTIDDAEPDAK